VAAAVLAQAGGLGNQAEGGRCRHQGRPAAQAAAPRCLGHGPHGNPATTGMPKVGGAFAQHLLEAEAMLGGSLDSDGGMSQSRKLPKPDQPGCCKRRRGRPVGEQRSIRLGRLATSSRISTAPAQKEAETGPSRWVATVRWSQQGPSRNAAPPGFPPATARRAAHRTANARSRCWLPHCRLAGRPVTIVPVDAPPSPAPRARPVARR